MTCIEFDIAGIAHVHCGDCDAIVRGEQSGPTRSDVDVIPEHGRVVDGVVYCLTCAPVPV